MRSVVKSKEAEESAEVSSVSMNSKIRWLFLSVPVTLDYCVRVTIIEDYAVYSSSDSFSFYYENVLK